VVQAELAIILYACILKIKKSSAYGVVFDPDSDFDPEERNPNNMKCVARILEVSFFVL